MLRTKKIKWISVFFILSFLICMPIVNAFGANTESAAEPTESLCLCGDVDGNGKIQSADARLVLRFCARLESPTDAQLLMGDIDHDNKIKSSDARRILRISARLENRVAHLPGDEATCTQAQVCKICGEVLIDAKGHEPGAEATCTEPQRCVICDVVLAEALGHDLATHEGKAATCTEPGWTEYETCSRCDYSSYAEIPAEGHKIVFDAAVDATNTETGLTEGQHCMVCGEVFVAQETIPVTCVLTLSSYEFEVENTNETVFFYAAAPVGTKTVKLFDAKTNSEVAEMKDDGMYSSSGDDIPNDSIFSFRAAIDIATAETYIYYAEGYGIDENGVELKRTSSNVKLEIYNGFTSEELDMMSAAEKKICEVIENESFLDLSDSEKIAMCNAVIDELIESNAIEPDSIAYDEINGIYSFAYTNGIKSGIMLKAFGDEYNGDSSENDQVLNLGKEFGAQANDSTEKKVFGKALILFSFENTPFRVPFYDKLKSDWDSMGLDTNLDKDVTVDDLKNINSDNKIICISGHGAVLWGTSALCLKESVNNSNRVKYSKDLHGQRISAVVTPEGVKYWVYPALFREYYNENSFIDSFIFSECCCFYGLGNKVSKEFGNVFLNCGAKAVIGFHNSVLAVYCRDFMKNWISALVSGLTAKNAYQDSVEKFGDSDGQPFDKATPVFDGDEDALLIDNAFKNGSFEAGSTAKYWDCTGDTRVITALGELIPQDEKQMVILTTGLGSKEAEYLSGTEGSVISQTFIIPSDKTMLSFDYDVVSEEPMEYVGSNYDDKFIVEIRDVDTEQSVEIARETINSSEWTAIENIDFEGGDSTTYHTEWKTVYFDVSEYQGKTVTLRFIVFDVGDSIYDTAALVDNVVLK